MALTELLFPVFKQDPVSQATLKSQGPEIFNHFRGIPGLQSIFRGSVIVDDGKPVDASSGRSVLVLEQQKEWDTRASLADFYPNSPTFQSFIKLAKPLVAAPDIPELFDAAVSSRACAEAGVMQVLKVKLGSETERVWGLLREALLRRGDAGLVFSHASGIEEQEGVFLGMVGWGGLGEYERSREDEEVRGLLGELGAGGVVLDVVVQLDRLAV
ncbi:hypothetical protein BJX76DRAFT_349933 [Aspergillus varians]